MIYSLMEAAKANGLRLEDYILHLLSVLPERLDADPHTDIDDLRSWNSTIRSSHSVL